MNFPKRWQDCEPFVRALLKRKYVLPQGKGIHLCMADGAYLYMYECWQDGRSARG